MEPQKKKLKTEESDSPNGVATVDAHLPFHEFKTEKTILVNAQSKLIAVVGTFDSNTETRGVLVAEKQPLTESSLTSMLSPESKVTKNFQNDVYSQYILNCPGGSVGEVKVTAIYPATEAHVNKYSEQALVMVRETPDDYQNITRLFVMTHPLGVDVRQLSIVQNMVLVQRSVMSVQKVENAQVLMELF